MTTTPLQSAPPSAADLAAIDTELSRRHLHLDPAGYFVIFVDRDRNLICAKHFGIVVNEDGLAIDPSTGKPLPAKGEIAHQAPPVVYSGRTAKELCVKLFEQTDSPVVSQFEHAAYLGREFVRAEIALRDGSDYSQD
ncbi:MAG: DUF4346 domain-containing protein [Cyanobacteria bacterium J06648_11]